MGHASDVVLQAASLARAPDNPERESAADHRDDDGIEAQIILSGRRRAKLK